MKLLIGLTLVNLGLLSYQVVSFGKANAAADDGMLRGTGLEIVDPHGRLRAQLKLEPADSSFEWPDGRTGYPETVIFRLITADGKPRVKLTTSVEASGLSLVAATDTTHIILQAEGDESSLKLRNDEATQVLLRP